MRAIKQTRDVALGIAAATVFAFLPVFRNQFVSWDDYGNFITNFAYRGLDAAHLHWMFTGSAKSGMYIPLTWLTLGVDFQLWGMDPRGYHLTNLFLHALCAVLFFQVALLLLDLAWSPEARDRNQRIMFAAAVAAFVFAVHPLRVESVAWVTERRDVLSGVFYLLTLLGYLKYALSAKVSSRWKWYAAALVSYSCALLSKPIVVTLPVVLTLLDCYPLRRKRSAGLWVEKIPFYVLTIPIAGLAVYLQSSSGFISPLQTTGLLERIALALYGASFYLCKTFLPFGLSPFYPLGSGVHWREPICWLSFAVVTALSIAAFGWRKRFPALAASWVYYLIVLLPVSGLFLAGQQKAADRYSYLPCMSVALVVGALFSVDRVRRTKSRPEAFLSRWRMLTAIVLISGLMALTWNQCRAWTDSRTLWNRVLSKYPDSVLAHNNLGTYLQSQGQVDEAIEHYRRSIEIKPEFSQAHSNLGNALQHEGKVDEAVAQFQESIRLNPQDAGAYSSLGIIYFQQGNAKAATTYFQRSIELNPTDEAAHTNLGVAWANQGRLKESIAQFQEALRIDPTDESARRDLDAVQAQLAARTR